jgi:hypothetical protein
LHHSETEKYLISCLSSGHSFPQSTGWFGLAAEIIAQDLRHAAK